ncbi:MAG: tetratricopeptide repeat protein [Oscillospiraceae bacterium]
MFCMNCGYELPDNSKFCNNCGTPVDGAQTPEKTIEIPKLKPNEFVEISREQLHEKQEQCDRQSASAAQPAQQTAQAAQTAPPNQVQQAQQIPQQVAQPMYSAPQPMQPEPVAAPKASGTKRNVIILVVVLVLLIAGTAIGLFATGVVGKPDPEKLLTTAEKYLSEANYEQAIIEFDKILKIDPTNVDAYLGKAEALNALGRSDEAKAVLDKALKKIKDEGDLGKIEKAIADMEETGSEEIVVTLPVETLEQPTEETADVPSSGEATSEDASSGEATSEESSSEEASTEEGETDESLPVNADIVYGDPEVLAIEEMLRDYFNGSGSLDTAALAEVTQLQLYHTGYISVVCGSRGGTQLDVAEVKYGFFNVDGFTLALTSGENLVYTSYTVGNIDIKKLTSLDFVQYMPKLEFLATALTQYSDLSPLKQLSHLERLEMTLNIGSENLDISPLADMPQVKHLVLSRVMARDYSVIENMTQLESLKIAGTVSVPISYSRMTSLKKLTTIVDDLSSISGLSNLEEAYLEAAFYGIDETGAAADISALKDLNNLKKLTLQSYSGINSPETFSLLTSLEELNINNCDITDFSAFKQLTNLKKLNIYIYDLSEDVLNELKAALPDCEVTSTY